jgi:hypothetical protein
MLAASRAALAPFFEVARLETRWQKGPSFGVSGEARLLPYDRTKAGEDMSSKKDLA